jgi:hypothetical protein
MTWRITNWAENFENNRTRGLKVMLWVPIPVNLSGSGYAELVSHPTAGAAHLGVWLALVEVAARCDPRGTLVRGNGTPHDTESLSLITRIPAATIAEALPRLQLIGWIEEVAEGADKAHEGAGRVRESAQEGAAKLPYRKEGRKEEQAGNGAQSVDGTWDAEAAFRELWDAYPAKGRTDLTLSQSYYCEEIRDQATHAAALASVTTGKWARSDKWARGFVKALPAWIHNRAWESEDPEPSAASAPPAQQSTMSPETRRRIIEAGL